MAEILLSGPGERRFSELRQEGRTLSGTLLRYGDVAVAPVGAWSASSRGRSAT